MTTTSLILFTACASGASDASEPTLNEIFAAVEKYRDVNVAIADGYDRDLLDTCETPLHMGITGNLGTMGIHFLRRDLLEIDDQDSRLDVAGAHTDFLQPAGLVYEPQADGSLELVAVENLVSADAWERAGNRDAPTFQGIPYEHWPDDPAMSIQAQYDRHIWLRDNPSGVFAQYNPNVSCEHHDYNMPMMVRPDTIPPSGH
ncbi:MAG: hypothetical protein GEU90_09585 [Gemmatimonas sp.]|nr:hypothetical protein [Gemmatimonas sp.]